MEDPLLTSGAFSRWDGVVQVTWLRSSALSCVLLAARYRARLASRQSQCSGFSVGETGQHGQLG